MRPPTSSPQDPSHHHTFDPPNPYDELAHLAPHDGDILGLGFRYDTDDDGWGDDGYGDPPGHRAGGRRRHGGVARASSTVKVLVGLLVLAAFATLADRWALLQAENAAEDKVQESLGLPASPEVDIRGVPFLTQLAGGQLNSVGVTIPDVAAKRVSLAKVDLTARDVTLKGDVPESVEGAVVNRMRGEVLLSFDDLERELGLSQMTFQDDGRGAVRAVGELPVAGHEVRLHAEAHVRRVGDRAVDTRVGGIRLGLPGVATYQPGRHGGLTLSREAAEAVRQDAAKAKALLSVPSVTRQLGVSRDTAREAVRHEERLHELTGTPRFLGSLMRVNLVDAVAGHPEMLKAIGLDPGFLARLMDLAQRQLPGQLSASHRLPDLPGDVRLHELTVKKNGIHAEVSGNDLPFGSAAEKRGTE